MYVKFFRKIEIAIDLVLIFYTYHLRQSSCATRKFPKAYLAMLLDLNHVAQEIFATKCSSIWLAQYHSDEIHLEEVFKNCNYQF